MSYKASVIKLAIKCTPTKLIVWIANYVLKGVAELQDFSFDLDSRKLYAEVLLLGESESIRVWLEDFAVLKQDDSYQVLLSQAKSNRLWLDNIFARFTGKAWTIPVPPPLVTHMDLLSEVFAQNPKASEAEDDVETNPVDNDPSQP